MTKNIAVIRGDGIGPEIVQQALLVLDKIAALYGHEFTYTDVDMGGNAIDKWSDPLPQSELDKCLASDSVLLGAVGGPKWNDVPGHMRPEKGLLRLRAGMGVYSNNRPAKIWKQLASASPLKQEIVDKGIDFIIVRELIGCVTPKAKLAASDALALKPPKNGASAFAAWKKATCWIPPGCGRKSSTNWQQNTPMWSLATCW